MSTVHICLNDILGVAVACEVIFYPGDTPFFNGSALAVSGARSIRLDAGGNGSVTLLPGRYAVRFSGITGNTDTLLILVPTDEGDYPLSELICGGNWVLPLRDFLLKGRNLADVADPASAFNAIKQAATVSSSGVVQLATQAEVDAGTNASKAVTPATLAAAARWVSAGQSVKLVSVADAASRLALSAIEVNVGDAVEQSDTHEIYEVIDVALLAQETGYVLVGIRPTTPPPSLLLNNLLAYWKLDESEGARADATGNGNDLSDNNSVGVATGKVGNAASFDGSNYLMAASAILGATDDFTIVAWVNFSTTGSYLIAASSYPDYISFGISDVGLVHLTAGVGDGVTGGSVNSDEWSLIVARREGDSISVSVNAGAASFGTVGASSAPAAFTVSSNSGGEAFFNGLIDEVGVWNRALSDSEITQLYNGGNGLTYPFA